LGYQPPYWCQGPRCRADQRRRRRRERCDHRLDQGVRHLRHGSCSCRGRRLAEPSGQPGRLLEERLELPEI
ncbi:hypothetical protein GGF47_002245, partial [Coemansia sp. RSA 2524]